MNPSPLILRRVAAASWLRQWPRRCLRLLAALGFWLATLQPAQAHTFITITGDLLVDGEDLNLTLNLSPADIAAVLEPAQGRLTRGQLTALLPRLGPYLLAGVTLAVDGVAVPGMFDGYLPDLLAAGGPKPPDDEPLPLKLPFVLSWKLPSGANRLELACRLFPELKTPGVCHLELDPGDGGKRQARYIELGRSGTFYLHQVPTAGAAAEGNAASAPAPASGAPPGPVAAPPAEPPSFWQFIGIGFTHILPEGTDHILFVLGLFLLSPKPRPLLVQITAFTVAHSISLGLSLGGVVSLNSRVVETLIAFSIAVVAIENVFYREVKPWRWLVVFAFGLIHGLGFAGALRGLDLPSGSFLPMLVGFNLGVECGQLAVVAIAIGLTVWWWRRPWYHARLVVPASLLIAAVGLVWAVQRAFDLRLIPG
jgi:hypothetical protein